MNAIEYIKRRIKDFDEGIDTSTGSPIGDLFVNPLSLVIQDNIDFEEHLLSVLGIQDPETLTEDELDALASNFLVTRIDGAKASGYVKLFYSVPTSVTVPLGTIFSTQDGKTYLTTSTYAITRDLMSGNTAGYPYYSTGNIPVESSEYGEEFFTKAYTINSIISTLNPLPAMVKNPLAIIGGGDRETNTALKSKIISSSGNQSVASPNGIKKVLQNTFPTITSLTVKANGDAEMLRDITYSGVEVGNYYTSDFNAKVSGLLSYPHNESIAYVGRFEDTDETTVVELPDPSDFIYELTNTSYAGLMKDNDPLYSELGVYNILEENFDETTTATGYKKNWIASDGLVSKGNLARAGEIQVDSAAIKLGIYEVPHDPTAPTNTGAKVYVSLDQYQGHIDKLNSLINASAEAVESAMDQSGKGGVE